MTFNWTMEALDRLRALHAEGKTFLEIASALGISRCSVAGKVRRLKLPHRDQSFSAQKRWGNIERKPNRPKAQPFTFRKKHERKPPMLLRVVTAPDSVPVPLMERTGCCYPTTVEKPHLFCNAPQADGTGGYCELHFKVMYPNKRRVAG
jgi:GcrA cell cycle regulator